MDKDHLYNLMENPSLLNCHSLAELRGLIDKYPYFPSIRMMYLERLLTSDNVKFREEFENMAIYIPDRRKLFLLIEGAGVYEQPLPEKETTTNGSFELINSFLSKQEGSDILPQSDIIFQPSASADYFNWAFFKDIPVIEEDQPVAFEQNDLIESFIKKSEEGFFSTRLSTEQHNNVSDDKGDIYEELDFVKQQEDTFFTETLSQIYIKQKRYERALEIIRKLSLKYPEKNVYFVDQIRFLEKLIINNKKNI